MTRSLVLTSTENFVWSSMQEIIPSIESAWKKSAGRDHHVRIVDVGREPLAAYLADALVADHLVFTCFTMKLAKLGRFLRAEASVPGRYVTYLHNQATIACWPLFEWGPGDLFREDDVFVSSSKYDARTLKLSLPRAKVVLHPFWLPHGPGSKTIKATKSERATFFYSGRISSQKNLHTLLLAFKRVLDRRPTARLVCFGGEDGLGSPNMGTKDVGYLERLRALTRDLGLEDSVEFTGHLSRESLHERLKEPHVLVSASLHSDENFGMSALRSLCLGRPAVLSKWGGHADFAEEFASRLELVSVRGSKHGPWVDPKDFARAMIRASDKQERTKSVRVGVPEKYRIDTMASSIRKLVATPRAVSSKAKKAKPLAKTPLADSILKNRVDMKIFDSYADPRCHRFLSSYGMGAPSKAVAFSRRSKVEFEFVPWVSCERKSIVVDDPHRGRFTFATRAVRDLVESGWAFKI